MNIPRSISQPHKTRSLSQIEPLESLLTPRESICEYWTTLTNGYGPTQGQRKTLARMGIEPMNLWVRYLRCSTD